MCVHLLFRVRSIRRTATIIPGTHSEDVTILERCARTRAAAEAEWDPVELSNSAVAMASLRREVWRRWVDIRTRMTMIKCGWMQEWNDDEPFRANANLRMDEWLDEWWGWCSTSCCYWFSCVCIERRLPRNVLSVCLISEFRGANIILMASNRVLISDHRKHNRSNIIM